MRQLEESGVAYAAREAQDLRRSPVLHQADRPGLESGDFERLAQRGLDLPVQVERGAGRRGDGVERRQLLAGLVQVAGRREALLLEALAGPPRVRGPERPLDLDRHERRQDVGQQGVLAAERQRVVPRQDQGAARAHGRADPEHQGGAELRRPSRIARAVRHAGGRGLRLTRLDAGAEDDARGLTRADLLDRLLEAPGHDGDLVLRHVPPLDPPEAQRGQAVRRLDQGDGAVGADDLDGAGRPLDQDRLGTALLRQGDLQLAQRLKMRQERSRRLAAGALRHRRLFAARAAGAPGDW